MRSEFCAGRANALVGRSPVLGGDFPALFCALAARFGAAFAMLVVVLAALGGASVADLRAKLAEMRVELRSAAHESRRQPAKVGAINTEPRAFFHAPQAGVAAMFALLGATNAGVDAALVGFVLMWHLVSFGLLFLLC